MGFGLCFLYLRNVKGFGWNHKRVYRIYGELELNLRIKPRKRLVREKAEPLTVPVGIKMDDAVWGPTVFSKNRERLIEHDVVTELFNATVEMAGKRGLLWGEHFSVDGTLIQAWVGHKSFVAKDDGQDGDGGSTAEDFRGQRRSNDTHESRTDGDARLYRKGNTASELRYMGHTLSDNRHGLIASAMVTTADVHGRPRFAKLPAHCRTEEEIAPVHPDFRCE